MIQDFPTYYAGKGDKNNQQIQNERHFGTDEMHQELSFNFVMMYVKCAHTGLCGIKFLTEFKIFDKKSSRLLLHIRTSLLLLYVSILVRVIANYSFLYDKKDKRNDEVSCLSRFEVCIYVKTDNKPDSKGLAITADPLNHQHQLELHDVCRDLHRGGKKCVECVLVDFWFVFRALRKVECTEKETEVRKLIFFFQAWNV